MLNKLPLPFYDRENVVPIRGIYPLDGIEAIIAIGHTTADFLQARGLKHVLMPKTPTEADVVELLRQLEA